MTTALEVVDTLRAKYLPEPSVALSGGEVTAAQFAERLRARRTGPGKWQAKCPAHDDRVASLSIAEGQDGRVLVNCHAGCDTENILEAMGLTMCDLFPPKDRIQPQPKPQTIFYDYCDARGHLLHQTVRFPEKKIRQRRPDGHEKWVWNLNGITRVLYHLADVLKADLVMVPEGEKDCDNLTDLHLERYSMFQGRNVATTTNSLGAGRWEPSYGELFKGKDVLVFEDNDDAGRKHALDVLRSVHPHAKSVKLISLPGLQAKGDVSDWMRDHSVNDLLAEIQRAPVWFPEPVATAPAEKAESAAEENVTLTATGAEILDWVVNFLRRFVSLTTEQARAVALMTVHTHAIDAADCTPYLAINSAEKQSGKTRLLEVQKLLVRDAWFTGRVTAAVLVRKIDAKKPTLLLDESDAAFRGDPVYAEALRGVLNQGYRRGGCSSLCVGQGAAITYQDFSTFCPKAIAGIGKLPDTVADRSIPIRLKRAPRGKVERFRERDAEQEAKPQKSQIAAWCKAHIEELRNARPDIPNALSDRQADVCEPLLAIADAAGGEWPKNAREALLKLCAGAQADDGSIGVRLLQDIKSIFAEKKASEMASAALCDALADIETSPWAEWSKGKHISPMGLARLLSPFEVYPGPLSSGQLRGYRLSQFREAFALYIPLQGVKVSESQYPCGVDADFKVSNENSSDTLKSAVSANNDAGSRHLDTLKTGIEGDGAQPEEAEPNFAAEEQEEEVRL